ncbi:MAG: glycosyltransferase family 2 protein [Pikeienuella sp.]
MTAQQICAIIPTHNHARALPDTLRHLRDAKIATLVVDDGSTPDLGREIEAICQAFENVEHMRHSFNGGKGFAVMCGMARAAERGFTHAVQIDADGQHDLGDLASLLATSAANPDALIAGTPVYDKSVPLARKWGRKLTNFWAGVNATTFKMPDAMCGFRVYPVQACLNVVRTENVTSRRMEFDTEILVASHWAGQRILPCPVHVTYPEGNSSNFDMLRDNVGLSVMHTRMFFGMLMRAPRRVANLFRPSRRTDQHAHWPEVRERGVYAAMYLLALIYRGLGPRVCRALLYPVIGFFFLTGTSARAASRDYLERAWKRGYLPSQPTTRTSFRHFLAFGEAALDKFAAWTGNLSSHDVDGIMDGPFRDAERAGGAFVVTAHLGNPEVLRAIAGVSGRWRVNVLVHTAHAEMFNRVVERFSGQSTVRMTQVTEVGPDTAIALSEALDRGEWVVMVADRVPVSRHGRTVDVPFMGETAAFPQGPYILASILKCPTYAMFCTKTGGRFDVNFELLADRVHLPRADREGAIKAYAAHFAELMERQVAKRPMQWFNFYPYWKSNTARQSQKDMDA